MAAMVMVRPQRGENETQNFGKNETFDFFFFITISRPTTPCPSARFSAAASRASNAKSEK
jgi:hypothetical protein